MKLIKKILQVFLLLFIGLIVIGVVLSPSKEFEMTKNGPAWFNSSDKTYTSIPINNASYFKLDNEVGCSSTYNDAKKEDIFDKEYKDHWMEMSGEIVILDDDKVSLNVDGKGTQDISVRFLNKSSAYELEKGKFVKIQFLMTSEGGCFLPFLGKHAILVKE